MKIKVKTKKHRPKEVKFPPSAADYPEYAKMTKGYWIHGDHPALDPVKVLSASRSHPRVVAVAQQAITLGCRVNYRVSSCHVGWFADIVFHEPMPEEISKELSAIDAAGIRDYSLMSTTNRWNKKDKYWSWTLELG